MVTVEIYRDTSTSQGYIHGEHDPCRRDFPPAEAAYLVKERVARYVDEPPVETTRSGIKRMTR